MGHEPVASWRRYSTFTSCLLCYYNIIINNILLCSLGLWWCLCWLFNNLSIFSKSHIRKRMQLYMKLRRIATKHCCYFDLIFNRVSVSSLQTDLMFFICPYVSLAKWRSHASFIQSLFTWHVSVLVLAQTFAHQTMWKLLKNVQSFCNFHWNVHKNRSLEKHLMSPFKILWYGYSIIALNYHTRSKIHRRLFSTACLCYIQP